MIEFESIPNNDTSKRLIQIQLIIGIIAVPFLIVRELFNVLTLALAPYGADVLIIMLIANNAGIIGAAFLVVGTIAVIKRNGSNLAWIFVAVFSIGQVWRYSYNFLIFPGIIDIPNIDTFFVLSAIGLVYQYSIILISLYAWLSIRSAVKYRPLYFTYLILYAFGGIAMYLVTGILFGFGPQSISSFEESLAFRTPGLIIYILTTVVLSLFFISQLYDSRTEQENGSSTTELDNW